MVTRICRRCSRRSASSRRSFCRVPRKSWHCWRWRSKNSPRPLTSRSEEHTSELQSLMRISYAFFFLNNTISFFFFFFSFFFFFLSFLSLSFFFFFFLFFFLSSLFF